MYVDVDIFGCTHNISHLKLHSLFNSFQNRSMRKQPKTEIKHEVLACRSVYTLAVPCGTLCKTCIKLRWNFLNYL